RTVGTRVESISREWKDRRKRGRRTSGKSGVQTKSVTRTELKVGKYVSHASRKAAIVYIVPVP
ncbi:hypothetical protein, partial [[Clostridium] hylemonae]|uniref:hypothetical protein n=1 Tax=[Clostridium] hylemonae TaxID=89153 RepID=UPI001A989B52